MDAYAIIVGIIFYFAIFVIVTEKTDGFWFNPKENYEKWHELNWFGVWFLTILYWIFFLPITIMVAISWLFTVGRK